MQLDADRYPLLYSIRGALSPARKNAKAARQASDAPVIAILNGGPQCAPPLQTVLVPIRHAAWQRRVPTTHRLSTHA